MLTGDWRRSGVDDPPDEGHVARDLQIFLRDGALWSPPLRSRAAVERDNEDALRQELARRPDVVSVWHMGAMSTGLLQAVAESGVPAALVVCDDWPTYAFAMDPWMRMWRGRPRLGRIAGRLLGLATQVADLDRLGPVCFVSETTRRRCREHSPWMFPDSTVTFSGIDPGDFPVRGPDAARPRWGWRLLAVGRLDPRKGFETAIRALALLPDATLDIYYAGDDPYRSQLEELGSGLGLADRLRFGTAERARLADVYSSADAVLFTPEWEEPFGLVPVEAMACATPVVTTAAGGSGEFLVDGVNCVRVERGDPSSLARGVERLAADPALRRTLVVGGTSTATEFGVDRLAQLLWERHEQAMSQASEAPAARSGIR